MVIPQLIDQAKHQLHPMNFIDDTWTFNLTFFKNFCQAFNDVQRLELRFSPKQVKSCKLSQKGIHKK